MPVELRDNLLAMTEDDLKEVKATVKETVDGAVEAIMEGMRALHEETTQRIDGLETNFSHLETRLDHFETRFDHLETRMEDRFEAVDDRLDRIDGRLTRVEDHLGLKAEAA